MKKFLVFGLILAIAGGAFAQSFTIGGGISTGLSVEFDSESDVVARMRNPGTHNGIRLDLTGAAVNALDTVGANFTLRWDHIALVGWSGNHRDDGGATISFLPTVRRANVWVALVPGFMRLSLGIGGPGGFGTLGPINNSLKVAEGDMNVTMLINPVPQVTIGATLGLPPVRGVGGEYEDYGSIFNFDVMKNVLLSTGVVVNLPSAIDFVFNVQYQLPNKKPDPTDPTWEAEEGKFSLAAGFDFLALRIVTFAFDAEFLDVTGDGNLNLGQSIKFNFGDFGATLNARQYFNMDTSEDGPVLLFDANVQYTFGQVTPRLGLGYGFNTSQPNDYDADPFRYGNLFYDELRPASAFVKKASNPDEPWRALIINPNVLFNFGASDLEVGFSMYWDGNPRGESNYTTFNAIYFAYKYNF